jgi:hypothetical protein
VTTSADSASDQTATVEAVTIDSDVTTIADNETATDDGAAADVTAVSLIDETTGNDTLFTTTIGIDYIIQTSNGIVCARQ